MRRAVILGLVLVLGACRPGGAGTGTGARTVPQSTALSVNATVQRVVDGDTIDVSIDGARERVRLIGIDTPETKKEGTPIQCYGPEASAHTEDLLPPGTAVHLERDKVARDDYGRLLAYVYRAADGLFVNLDIVRQGFARTLTIRPNTAHAGDFADAARFAKAQPVGLWAKCTG